MKKLNKEDLKKKKRFHEKRVAFYHKKLKDLEYSENKIGFKWY